MAGVILATLLWITAGTVHADALESTIERLDRLEEENRQLRNEIEKLKEKRAGTEAKSPNFAVTVSERGAGGFLRTDPDFSYEILDPNTNRDRKQRLILHRRKDDTLRPDSAHVQGAVTAVANYQSSNRADKFAYVMRHPGAVNQVGDEVSEAAIHSAQLGFTALLGDWITGHAQVLYDPQQSFGKGTNTDLERNQLQMRRAYALFGNLDRSPVYASLGKMAIPFGLTDTVNPFSESNVSHAFGGLANGVTVGLASDDLNLSVMGVQGGAQFRAANAPVAGTTATSRLNNLAVDAHYSFDLGAEDTLLLGGSYLRGSAFCQDFPVVHFMPCRDNNPAVDVYGQLTTGDLTLKVEFAETLDVWLGTFNPALPQFPASEVTSFDVGAKYRLHLDHGPVDISAEFSRLETGPDGAPWERQDQLVLGVAWFARPSVKLFAEYVHVAGFAPLNFISGGSVRDENGNILPDRTVSDASARTDVFLVGVNAAF